METAIRSRSDLCNVLLAGGTLESAAATEQECTGRRTGRRAGDRFHFSGDTWTPRGPGASVCDRKKAWASLVITDSSPGGGADPGHRRIRAGPDPESAVLPKPAAVTALPAIPDRGCLPGSPHFGWSVPDVRDLAKWGHCGAPLREVGGAVF